MRIFITLLTTFLLIGCSADPNDYDYNLKKSDVVCNLIKKEKEVTTGRYTREYMRETYKCSFITFTRHDYKEYLEKEELKELIKNSPE